MHRCVPETWNKMYPFSTLKGGANVLIFPDLDRPTSPTSCCRRSAGRKHWAYPHGNEQAGSCAATGREVDEIVSVAAIAVVDAQETGAAPEMVGSLEMAEAL